MTPHNLPQDWQWVKLGEICDTSSGGTPSRSQPNYWNGEIKWLKSGELNDGLVDKVEETISQEGLKHSSAKVLPKGTLLIAMYGATIGRLGILNIQTSTNQAICAITPKESNTINTKFLFWFLFASRPKMLQDSFGGAQKNISQTYLKQFSIPLPPLKIQKEIVEILESKLEKIASAKALLESSLKKCETYRLSLLNDAFNSNLTPYSQNWKQIVLGEICQINPKTNFDDFSDSQIVSFIPMKCVEEKTNRFTTETRTYQEVKKGYTRFQNQDILFAKITPCMENGKICIVDNLINQRGLGSTEFHILRCNQDKVLPHFVFFFMVQNKFLKAMEYQMTGAVGQKRIKADIIAKYKIPLPPLKIQKEIVEILESKLEKIASAKALLESSLKKCETYRLSLLESAFEGKLVQWR